MIQRKKFFLKSTILKKNFFPKSLILKKKYTQKAPFASIYPQKAQILRFTCNFRKHDFEENFLSKCHYFECNIFSKSMIFKEKDFVKNMNLKKKIFESSDFDKEFFRLL